MFQQTIPKRFSFHFHITTLFSILILLCGLLIGWYSYLQLSKSILNSGERIFTESTQKVETKLLSESQHITTMLKILASSQLTEAINVKQKLLSIPTLKEMLDGADYLNALFIAYPNNDFFIFRKIVSEQYINQFQAPPQSRYMLTLYTNGKARHHFYDQKLQLTLKVEDANYQFDSKSRPWYTEAKKSSKVISSNAYIFYSTQELGITKAIYNNKHDVVIGADYVLTDLSNLLATFNSSPYFQRMIINNQGELLAYQDLRALTSKEGKLSKLKPIQELAVPELEYVYANHINEQGNIQFSYDDQQWLGNISKLGTKQDIYLVQIVPVNKLLLNAYVLRNETVLIILFIILLTLPIAWYFSKLLTSPIRQLTDDLRTIKNFDFSTPINTHTVIKEIHELIEVSRAMKETISHFQNLSSSLVGKQSFQQLLQKISIETNTLSHSLGTLILLNNPAKMLSVAFTQFNSLSSTENKQLNIQLQAVTFSENELIDLNIEHSMNGTGTIIPTELNSFIIQALQNDKALSWRLLPLVNRSGEWIGVLAVINEQEESNLHGKQSFIQAIASFSALAIEGQILLAEQKQLLESFIQLMAGAIDSKSPYTGGHCARVPELTKMLCQAACEENKGEFAKFSLNDEQWEELHIAAWLHDCGKIVTPEYVVDKATKLETIYDRIHEVRMRFELLKQQAHINYWKGIADGIDKNQLTKQRDQLLTTLDDEFNFVAECNIGGEFMSEEKVSRLQEIAQRTWTRTIDDTLGISPQEKKRYNPKKIQLPVQEPLLANKTEHLIKREQAELTEPGNRWGFNMKTPEYRFNRGELYNLSIQRGTLSDEDRFIINGHMVHTIAMLSKLPFPESLKNVPVIAGGHHEKMDGTGYPRGIAADTLPLTARMMVITDIFEALTASDRPYKEPKKLSEAIKIMSFMVKDKHIDPSLFKLFLSSGVYLEYAKKYLRAEQIDSVDINEYLI